MDVAPAILATAIVVGTIVGLIWLVSARVRPSARPTSIRTLRATRPAPPTIRTRGVRHPGTGTDPITAMTGPVARRPAHARCGWCREPIIEANGPAIWCDVP